jgi:hypothetical protein
MSFERTGLNIVVYLFIYLCKGIYLRPMVVVVGDGLFYI